MVTLCKAMAADVTQVSAGLIASAQPAADALRCSLMPDLSLQVDIIDLQPRPNPGNNNESYGFTGNYGIGWWAK